MHFVVLSYLQKKKKFCNAQLLFEEEIKKI